MKRGDILALPSGYAIQIIEQREDEYVYQHLHPLACYRSMGLKNRWIRRSHDLIKDGYLLIHPPMKLPQYSRGVYDKCLLDKNGKYKIKDGLLLVEIPET